MKTLILGLGNPILTDDAAGLQAARRLHSLLGRGEIDLVEAATAGLQSVQLLLGYDRAVIIDVMPDPERVGSLRRLSLEELGHPSSPVTHGIGLGRALQWAREAGLAVPASVEIYAIAVKDPWTFGEGLSPEVEAALPTVVQQIADELARLWPEEKRQAGS